MEQPTPVSLDYANPAPDRLRGVALAALSIFCWCVFWLPFSLIFGGVHGVMFGWVAPLFGWSAVPMLFYPSSPQGMTRGELTWHVVTPFVLFWAGVCLAPKAGRGAATMVRWLVRHW